MAGSERRVLEPIRIGGTTALRNRLYRAPVLEGAGDGEDAAATYAKQFVANAEADAIVAALGRHTGDRVIAASELGVSGPYLEARMAALGLGGSG